MSRQRLRTRLGSAMALLRDPVTAEKRALLDARWNALDSSLRVGTQALGRKGTGCGATIGIEPRCDFSCTGCYLGADANRSAPLPMASVRRELLALREWLGPKSNVQITDGEVTLRDAGELVEILRFARSIGIIPMVMTHGDRYRLEPGLLERLVVEGGLTETSIHVDVTQRGRQGHGRVESERELMPLRDEFASLIRATRRRTGRPLRAAMTVTVTESNLGEVADIVDWTVRNRDAFRLLSLQPLARVGRTRKDERGVAPDDVWNEIGKTTRRYHADSGTRPPLHFGHPDCSRFVPFVAVERSGSVQLLELIRRSPDDEAIMNEYAATGLLGATFRDDHPIEAAGRGLGMLVRAPRWLLGRGRRWVDRRLADGIGVSLARLALDLLRGRARVDGLTIATHHFMNADELSTTRGRERLEACVFRVPLDGRMVPMCEVNAAGARDALYRALRS